jgi:hypothetical protein
LNDEARFFCLFFKNFPVFQQKYIKKNSADGQGQPSALMIKKDSPAEKC